MLVRPGLRKFSTDQEQRIIGAIQSRLPAKLGCSACTHTQWTLADGFVFLSLSDSPGSIPIGGNGLPSVALTCKNCGNTLLFNLIVLGLRDLWESAAPEKAGMPQGGFEMNPSRWF